MTHKKRNVMIFLNGLIADTLDSAGTIRGDSLRLTDKEALSSASPPLINESTPHANESPVKPVRVTGDQ